MFPEYERLADKRGYCYYKRKKAPKTRPHFHAAYELIFVKSGVTSAIIDGNPIKIHAGEGCFVHPFLPHSFFHEDAETEVFIFVGTEEYFRSATTFLNGTPSETFAFSDFTLLEMLDEQMSEGNENVFPALFSGAVALLLARIAQSDTLLPRPSAGVSGLIQNVLAYVQERFSEDLSLSRLADKFGYSPQHFSRLFHKYLHISLPEHVNAVRVVHAQRLLDEGKSATEAAFESGFSSLETFYRTYKKAYGTTPTLKNKP